MASLEWDADTEKAIDRVAASGLADPFGLNLWKARYGLESAAFKTAIKQLTQIYLSRYRRESPEMAERLCSQIIGEYIAPFCTTCRGSKEVIQNDLKTLCSGCGGSGLRRYSDEERARLMAVSYAMVKALRHKMQWAYDYIATQDRLVNEVMCRELERD